MVIRIADKVKAPRGKARKAAAPAKPAKAAKSAKAKPAQTAKAVRTNAAKAKPVKAARKPRVEAMPIVMAEAAAPLAAETVQTLNEGTKHMKNETSKMTDRVHAVFGDVNERAKSAFERNSRIAEELGDLGKGNVEAFVASTRIAAKGLETVGHEVAEFGRKSFEDASAALKGFAEVKSPTDFFRLQTEFARAQFDAFVAGSSRLSETVVKLAGDVAEPLTSRYSVAADKAKAVAAL